MSIAYTTTSPLVEQLSWILVYGANVTRLYRQPDLLLPVTLIMPLGEADG